MQERRLGPFYQRLRIKKGQFPLSGTIELTYNCSLNCIHCYCKNSAIPQKYRKTSNQELTTQDWKKILNEIKKEGCLWVTFTGGDPLIRDDFLELYSFAKEKGFLVTIFTNAQLFSKEIFDYLIKSPPLSIEVTLNGITKDTYEKISRVGGSFSKAIKNIKFLAESKIPLIVKTNCLKQNKDELGSIKQWTEQLWGGPSKNRYHFKYDPMIYPRLNGDIAPTNFRLNFSELKEARRQDPQIWEEYQRRLKSDFPDLSRNKDFLYRCNIWKKYFFINPYGKLKFCMFSEKFSVDLKETPFKEGFYRVFPGILKEKFKTESKCRLCSLRPLCYNCPARAFLETGDEESPVTYYCDLAKATLAERKRLGG